MRRNTKASSGGSTSGTNNRLGLLLGRRAALAFFAALALSLIAAISAAPLLADSPPVVTIDQPSSITTSSAHLSGSVDPQGGPSDTLWHFEYSTDDVSWTPVSADQNAGSGSGAVVVEDDLTGLAPATTYFVRLVASNEGGANTTTSEPPDPSFETQGLAEAVTLSVTGPGTDTTRRLVGTVDANGLPTTYYFEYGPNIHYGSSIPISEDADAGSEGSPQLVAQGLTGLAPDTTYHYRIVATNAEGIDTGQDRTFTTDAEPPPPSSPPNCPNEAIRIEQGSTYLPDCRAYEQVSQADLSNNSLGQGINGILLSLDGERASYSVDGGTTGSSGGNAHFMASRTASGWVSQNALPPRSEMLGANYLIANNAPDLSGEIATVYDGVSGGGLPLSVVRLSDGGQQDVLHTFPSNKNGAQRIAASDDLSHVFMGTSPLTQAQDPSLLAGNIYDFGDGTPRLVSRMQTTNQAPSCGVEYFGTTLAPASRHWVATDGSVVFFGSRGDDCGGPTSLFARDLASQTTVEVSGPPLPGDPDSGITEDRDFLQAADDGSWAIYRTATSLAPIDDANGSENPSTNSDFDVYRSNLDSGSNLCLTCAVTNVGVSNADVKSAAPSLDGSQLYFITPAQLGDAPSDTYEDPEAFNLYVLAGASAQFIARVAPAFGVDIANDPGNGNEVTPDGNVLVFRAEGPSLNLITDSDNGGYKQFYRYDARSGELDCISCPPDGTPAAAPPTFWLALNNHSFNADVHGVTQDGTKVFFKTATPLVPGDINGSPDAYEWHDGTLSLISNGSATHSLDTVITTSRDGRDLLFVSTDRLTHDSVGSAVKVYDARVGGGFAAPPPDTAPCDPLADTCQGVVGSGPSISDPGSASHVGPGNQAGRQAKAKKRCRKGKHRIRGKCVRRQGRISGRRG